MRTLVVCLSAAFTVAMLPQWAAAQPPEGSQRPGPEKMLKHLDKDGDGVISADEAAKLPERLKALLKRADADGDKKVTGKELAEAVKKLREHRAGKGFPGRRPGPPSADRGPGRRPGPPPFAGRRPLPDPEEIFAKLDKDGDQQLSLEEFAEGMKKFREAHRPGPSHMRRPGPPCEGRFDGPPRRGMDSDRGPGPGMRGKGRPGPPCEGRFDGPPRRGMDSDRGPDPGMRGEGRPGPRQMRRPGPPREGRFDGPPRRGMDSDRGPGPGMRGKGRPGMGPDRGPGPGMRGEGRPGMGHGRPGHHRGGPEAMRERFKAADKNDDGKLSKEEAPERLQENFDKIDADDDGQLTPEELKKAFIAKMKEMRAKRGAGPEKKAKKPVKKSEKKPEKKADGPKSASDK